MKKVKFLLLGILSILLISPVVADTTDLSSNIKVILSHESLKSSNNIAYFFFGSPSFLTNNLSLNGSLTFFSSTNTSYGNSVDTSTSPFITDGFTRSFSPLNYVYTLIGYGVNGNNLDPTRFSVYFQADSSSHYSSNSGNWLLRFVGGSSQGSAVVGLNDSYVRMLYNNPSDLWFNGSNFPTSSSITPANSIQIFTKGNNYFYTEKGKFSVNGQYFDRVVSSVGNGFSFIRSLNSSNNLYRDDIKFYSVFPGWDSSLSSINIPSSRYTDQFYMFKMNSLGRDSSYDEIGVLSKCTIDLCSELSTQDFYSSLVFSNYICDFSSSFNFKNNCILGAGGILLNVLNTTGANVPLDLNTDYTIVNFQNSLLNYNANTAYSHEGPSLGVSFSLDNSFKLVISSIKGGYSYQYGLKNVSYPISYTGGYTISNSPDILGLAEYDVPENIDLNSGSAADVLDILCNSSVIKPVWCNRINEVAPGVDGFWWLDLSGNLVYSLVGYDQNNGGYWYDLQSDGSGGYQFVCDIETDFFCPITGSIGSFDVLNPADPHAIGFSGFILSQDYYDNFFTKTGYFARCPYPYTDFNIGLHNKVLNKFYTSLGFDIFLPINCGVAAFTAGKTFKFLSDVSLGLSPIMGEIRSPSDPRVYLYRFLDFLLSFALFMFLLKLYHLLN